jgi:hypothetical protein
MRRYDGLHLSDEVTRIAHKISVRKSLVRLKKVRGTYVDAFDWELREQRLRLRACTKMQGMLLFYFHLSC